ncbi:hypothetical protein JVU11DRAFT_7069 [Chiua virens]|nr:hypothetical protein JVU11DRAFT_7069 [Chiua virens]
MYPNTANRHSFKFPPDRLLHLRGTIPENELAYPTDLDIDNEHNMVVLKRGLTTGLTFGRGNNIRSVTRYYFSNNPGEEFSWEWAIPPYDSKSSGFSSAGDSGSIVVDGRGRIGGLLTGGTRGDAVFRPSCDITYATPITFLLDRMAMHGIHRPNIHVALTA